MDSPIDYQAEKLQQIQFEKDNILRLVREYVSVRDCFCTGGCTCWKCIFEYNLNCLDEVGK